MKNELEKLEEGPEGNISLNLVRATLKKIPNGKAPGPDGIQGFWFKNSRPSTTDWPCN